MIAATAGRQTHAVGGDRTLEEANGVVNRQGGGHGTARAIDVEVDFLIAILVLQVKQLLDHDIGQEICDGWVAAGLGRAAQKDDAVFQQQIAQRHLPLATVVSKPLDFWLERQAAGRHLVHGWEILDRATKKRHRLRELLNRRETIQENDRPKYVRFCILGDPIDES